jgi:hypothetical protein
MIFKKKNKLQKYADGAVYMLKDKISEMDGRKVLLYAGLGLAAIYGIRKLGPVAKIALPVLAIAAPRYLNTVSDKVGRAMKLA